jgi:hypothetical protein
VTAVHWQCKGNHRPRLFAEAQLAELEQLLSEAATATEASYEVVKKKLG